MYTERQYQHIVADVAEESMKAAVEQVKAYPHYATCGEVIYFHFELENKLNGFASLPPHNKHVVGDQ